MRHRSGRFAQSAELDRLLRTEADVVDLRASLDVMWTPVRLFQSALDQVQGRAAAPVPADRKAREAASGLGRSLARDLGEAAAVRAFVCEFYELQVARDAEETRLTREKPRQSPARSDTRCLRGKFHRLGVFLHQLREIPAVGRALDQIDAPEPIPGFRVLSPAQLN